MVAIDAHLFIYVFERDNAFQHRYKLAADVTHVEFRTNANSQYLPGWGFSTTLQYNEIYSNYIDHTMQFNKSMIQYCIYMIRNIHSLSYAIYTQFKDE